MNKRKIAITGAAGYIGSYLVTHLEERGHTVTSIDAGYFADCYVNESEKEASSNFIRKDVRQLQASDLVGFDTVIHLAGLSNDPLGDINASLTEDINSNGTINVADAAKEAGVKHFVFASSCSVYGAGDADKTLDELDPADPLTQYAKSKLDGEEYLEKIKSDAFRVTSVRAATVFGYAPRIRLDLVINELTAQAVAGFPITLNSLGNAWRPFIHVEDLSAAYAAIVEATPEDFNYNVYNVGAEATTATIIEIANLISSETGVEVKIKDDASADSRNYRVSFERFMSDFPSWTPVYDTAAGVKQIVENLKAQDFEESSLSDSRFRRLPRILEQIEANQLNTDLYWK